jgi:nucleotide-binding universal stress UspA family protein
MSTSTLSRPDRRTTALVVVWHGHGQEHTGQDRKGPDFEVPEWAARWARSSGWDLRRHADAGPGAAAAAAGPGARTLLLRPGTPASARREQQRPHVVAAVAALPDDEAVVADAVDCASAAGAALTFVHAVPCSFGERSVDLDGAVARGQRLLDAAASHAEVLRAGLTPATQLLRVRPHELVGEALDADLLVIGGPRAMQWGTAHPGADHRGSVQPGGLGLVAHSALHHAPCPVLLTPR